MKEITLFLRILRKNIQIFNIKYLRVNINEWLHLNPNSHIFNNWYMSYKWNHVILVGRKQRIKFIHQKLLYVPWTWEAKNIAIVCLTRNGPQYWDWIPLENSCNQFSFDPFSYSMRLDVKIYSLTSCANYSSLARVKTWKEYAVYFPYLVLSI